MDENKVTTYVNPSMAAMLGYSEGEMVGRPLQDFVEKKQHDRYDEFFQRRMEGIKERYESVLIHKNSSRVSVIVEAARFLTVKEISWSLAGVQDITDRKS